jgi:nucleotide-binding universal stress UspA family protein
MGTKGVSRLKEVFIGSNTAHVIQKVKCPVLAVPEEVVFKGLKKITYATSYQKSDITALKQVVDLAKLFGAKITLLHVADEHYSHDSAQAILKEFSEKIQDHLHYDRVACKVIYGTDAEEKLDEYVKQKEADLFVVSALDRNLFDRWFGRSITKTLAHHTHIPLMVFHHKENAAFFI